MSQRQTIARTRRQGSRREAASVAGSIPGVPAIPGDGRSALLSGTGLAALVASGLFTFSQPAVGQLPSGGVVVGGQATIAQNGSSQLTVNQSTDRGVIDWRSFSIGQGHRVDFMQPGRGSVTLNRVTGPDPSVIAGALNANGQIVLVNQAGVMFAGGAQVNVESLIASTANVANPKAFMAGGKIAFDQTGANPNARIVNEGTITVRDGGLVSLLGPSAANHGVINARLGRVTVAGAETFTVDLNGDGLVNFAVGRPVSQTPRDGEGKALALASNTGTINADGGQVAITAAAARGVVDGVVNVEGRINARTVANEGGVIVFGGGETTQVNVAGTIDVSGAAAGQKGGTVAVTASTVHVRSTAAINASGAAGGGTVLVGGGKQGAGSIANARDTRVDKGARITADASHKGNGGTVIVWADNATVFGGTISAKGGTQAGDGGFVETSGKVTLSLLDGASVSAGAPAGTAGLWLMDPTNLTLGAAEVAVIVTSLNGGTSVTTMTNAAGADDGNITLDANVLSIVTANQDVTWTLQAHGKIDLGGKSISITPFVGKTSSLVLDTATLAGAAADHSITGSGAITVTNLTANSAIAGGSVSLTGKIAVTTLNFNSNGAVTINDTANDISNIATVASTAGGDVTIVSTEATTIGAGGINAGANAISISTTGVGDNIVLSGTLTGGAVSLLSAGSLSGAGAIAASGAVSLKAANAGTINLTGAISGTGVTVESTGAVSLTNAGNVFTSLSATGTIGGAVTVVHNGMLSVNALTATGDVALTATGGTLTISGALTATGKDVALTGASISQAAAGVITAAGLSASAAGGTVDLTQATSAIATFAGTANNIGLLESDGFAIGSVNGVDGLTVGTLQLKAGGTITQSKGISATSAGITTSAGDVNLTGATNSITTFAANAAGFVALLETDPLQIGQVGVVGTLAALEGITAVDGVSIKAGGTVSQTATALVTAGTAGLAVVTTSGDINFATATNATKAVAFNAAGSASYKTSTDLAVTEVSALGANAKVTGATAAGTLALTTAGAAVITQTELISAPTLVLATGATGQITLTNGGNLIGAVQSSGSWGSAAHAISDSAGGLNVGPITSLGDVSLSTAGGGLTITGALNAGAKTVALKAGGANAITATAAAITAGTLTVETGAGGSISVQTASHDVATIASAGSGIGTGGMVFKQSRAGGTAVGPITSAGAVLIEESQGAVAVNAQIDAGSATVALLGKSGVSQANTGAGIIAGSLRGEATNGNVVLSPTGVAAADVNTVGTFAGVSGTGSVSYRNTGTFNVGKVDNTSGINAATSVSLQVNTAGKTITQSAGADGAIVTPTLNLTTNNGSVTISSTSNDIAALGSVALGSGALTVATARAGGFNVGSVTANGGISVTNTGDLTTSAALASDGDILLRSTAGLLTLGGSVTSNNNSVTLRSNGALNTGAFLVSAPAAVTGDVTLISDAGTVTIGAGGVTVGDTLTIQIGAGLTLSVSGAISANSVALIADDIAISAAINAPGTITLAPVTIGTAARIGGAAAAGFVIDGTELGFLNSAGTLTIGKTPAGVTTAGPITVATGTVANANLNLFTTAGISQTGALSVGGGAGALSVTAGGTVNLNTSGVNVGTVSGSTTSGHFLVLYSGAGGMNVGAITTAGGEIALRNFVGDLNINGTLTSNGGNILAGSNGGSTALNINATIDAGAGAIGLFSNTGGITQTAGKLVGVNLLAEAFGTTGGITLTSVTNAITGSVTLNAGSTSGNIGLTNTGSYSVGLSGIAYASFGGAELTPSLGSGIRAPGGAVTLTARANVTQATGVNDIVAATTLNVARIGAANPTVTLDNVNNTVTNLGTVSIGTGAFTLVDLGGLTITGAATAGGGYSVKTDGGSLTQNAGATIDTSAGNGTIALRVEGGFPFGFSMSLNDNLNAGTGAVSLNATGSVTQSGGAITADSVDGVALGVFGSVSLNSAANAFSTVTGSGNFGFSATSTKTLTVGFGGVLALSGSVTLTATGATSDIVIDDGIVTSATGTASLIAGGSVSQTVNGSISAGGLRAVATAGSVDISLGSNSVSTLAGTANGGFAYVQDSTKALTIGTVTTVGVTSTTGDITVKATGATLGVTQAVTASAAGGDVTLQSAGDLTFTAGITANAVAGRVSLTSTAGSVIQGGGAGVISGAELLANAATNVDLSTGGHSVGASGFAATATAGYVAFLNNNGLNIDSVGGTNGVTAGGAIFIGVSNGDLTQTATGIITAGAGLALFASSGSIVFDQQNLITGNVAVVSSPSANVTIRNKGDLNVGLVGPLAVSVGTFSANGIAASTAAGKFVSLISDTGVITQTITDAGSRISGGELRITTNGKDATLTNTSNAITAVGNSSLGAGKLTVFDSDAGLTVSAPVIADGGVILTTKDAFTLPGSITVANGDISLTSTAGSITLSSVLSAVNGQVQLDAQGAGGTVSQTGGSVTSKTLIARANGNVALDQADNDAGTAAGSSATGTFTYRDKSAVTIGSLIDSKAVGVSGITTANKDIIVVAGAGGTAGGIAVDNAVNAGSAIVRLQTATGDISQGASGLITGNSLLVNAAAGSINLSAAANAVVFVAGKSGGSLRLQTANATGVSDVAADAGALTTAASGLTSAGDMAIQTAGNLVLFSPLNAGAGTMRLRTTAGGQVFQLAGGTVTADALLIDAAGAVTLTNSANNDVNTIAGRSTGAGGTFRYQDKNGFTVGTVGADGGGLGPILPIGPLTGVTTAGADITLAAAGVLTINAAINAGVGGGTVRLLTGSGDLTQGGGGAITGGALVAISSGGMVNLAGAPNTVTGIAGSAFTSFLFQNSIGYAVSTTTFAGDGIVPAATGVTANSGGGATARVVDLAVASGTLTITGPVSSANGMIVYRRAPGGAAGAINVGGGVGTPANDLGTAKLAVIDLTGAAPDRLYGATPGTSLGGLFTTPTPATGFSPLSSPGAITGGSSQFGELSALNSTVYFFGSSANVQSTSSGSVFGLLGIYGNNNTVNLTTTVRTVEPSQVRAVTEPFTEPTVSGPAAAFFVRFDGLPTGTEQFNGCPIGTISCVVFTTPIAAPAVSTDDVVIGVAGAPLDDSGIVLVNQGNEDLILDDDAACKDDDEECKRRRQGAAQ